MPLRTGFEFVLPAQRALDLRHGHRALFRQSVGEHGHVPPVEEVEGPVVNAASSQTEFVDAVPENVRGREPDA